MVEKNLHCSVCRRSAECKSSINLECYFNEIFSNENEATVQGLFVHFSISMIMEEKCFGEQKHHLSTASLAIVSVRATYLL